MCSHVYGGTARTERSATYVHNSEAYSAGHLEQKMSNKVWVDPTLLSAYGPAE
jgi:hypothetical protein